MSLMLLASRARRNRPFDRTKVFSGGKPGSLYVLRDPATLFQDVAGTVRAVNSGDEVRCIKDTSGNGNHLTVVDTANPGTLRIFNGVYRVQCPAPVAFKTAATRTLVLPTYVCAATSWTVAIDGFLFGVVKAASQACSIRCHPQQNRIKSYLRGSTQGTVSLQCNDQAAPLKAPLVADSLCVAGTSDIQVNSKGAVTATNTWVDGAVESTTAAYGINISSSSQTSNTSQDFYGGLILQSTPSPSDRANIVQSFIKDITRPSQSSDFNVLILGDSTGDHFPQDATDSGEWSYRFALEEFANNDATAFVGFRTYDERIAAYGPEIIVQQGTGGPTYRFYNCSQAGRVPQFHTGKDFVPGVVNIPKPNAIMWNHGHNIAAIVGVSPRTFIGRFMGSMEQVRLQWPGVPHLAIRQNPWHTSDSMTALDEQLDLVSALYGDLPLADVYQAYLDYSPPKDSSLYALSGADNIHPSIPVGVNVWMPPIKAMWESNWPMPPAAPAFLSMKAENLLSNGRFSQITGGLPDGWALIGDGAAQVVSDQRDQGASSSVLITNGATVATAIRQSISATPYLGGSVTLAVRQYIPVGGDYTNGQIAISSDGTGAPSNVNASGGTTYGAGGWRWMVINLAVPSDASTITVDLYAAGIAGAAAGSVYLDRAVLVAGQTPRDAL